MRLDAHHNVTQQHFLRSGTARAMKTGQRRTQPPAGKGTIKTVDVTKALATLQPLYGKNNVEIVADDGSRVRGLVRSLRTTQALTKPSVKIERADGQIVKIPFANITEIIDHNSQK